MQDSEVEDVGQKEGKKDIEKDGKDKYQSRNEPKLDDCNDDGNHREVKSHQYQVDQYMGIPARLMVFPLMGSG